MEQGLELTPGGGLTAGLLAAPLVAVLLDLPRDAGLVVMMAPLGALIAASGAVWLLDRPRLRVGSLSLLALAALGAVRTLAR